VRVLNFLFCKATNALLFVVVDRLLLKTMTHGSRYAQIYSREAAFLCQRVEDNAFHPQQLVLSDRDIRGLFSQRVQLFHDLTI